MLLLMLTNSYSYSYSYSTHVTYRRSYDIGLTKLAMIDKPNFATYSAATLRIVDVGGLSVRKVSTIGFVGFCLEDHEIRLTRT